MITTIEELEKEYPKVVKDFRKRGFSNKQILKIYQIEYSEKAGFNVLQIRLHYE